MATAYPAARNLCAAATSLQCPEHLHPYNNKSNELSSILGLLSGGTGGRGEGGAGQAVRPARDGPPEAPRQKCVTWLPRPLVIYCVRVPTTVMVLCACAIGVRSHFVRESVRGARKK